MKRKSILIVLSGLLFFGLFAANVFAQDKSITVVQEQTRVIEEQIVLSDPTVAQPKKWLIGLSGEYWFVYNQFNRWGTNGLDSAGTMHGVMPGGTITVGYDVFTVSYSYRKGSFNCDLTFWIGAFMLICSALILCASFSRARISPDTPVSPICSICSMSPISPI